MERELFTEAEAQNKVGKKIRTLTRFSGVPEGTKGTVIKADPSGGGYTLAIQWGLEPPPQVIARGILSGEPFTYLSGGNPLVDWFTKNEYEHFLTEEEDENQTAPFN